MERRKSPYNGIITLLTVLLAVATAVEMGIVAHIAITIVENRLMEQQQAAQYEAYLQQQAELAENPPKVQYIGPTVQVTDGVLVRGGWEPIQLSEEKKNTVEIEKYTPAPIPKVEIAKTEPSPAPVQAKSSSQKSTNDNLSNDSVKPSSPAPSTNVIQPVDTPKPSASTNSTPTVSNSSQAVPSIVPSDSKQQTSSNSTPTPTSSNPTEPVQASSGKTIYITPTGKRYHYNNRCNGGTYIESTLEEATNLGLTPCNKCVN